MRGRESELFKKQLLELSEVLRFLFILNIVMLQARDPLRREKFYGTWINVTLFCNT